MSVYPKRILAGESIFVHTRASVRSPGMAFIRVLLEDPSGAMVTINEHRPTLFPATADRNAHGVTLEPEMRRVHPVYLAARHLVGVDGDIDSMLASLFKTRDSVHFHCAHPLADDAVPGKYRIHIEMRSRGRLLTSDTAKDAFFFVDKVSIREPRQSARGGGAIVINHAPHRTPARIVGMGARFMWAREIVLDPGENRVRFQGRRGFLVHGEGRHVWPLVHEGAKHAVRNEMLPWHVCPSSGDVLVHGHAPDEEGHVLTGKAKEVWILATGLSSREELVSVAGPSMYRRMVDDGLILEVP